METAEKIDWSQRERHNLAYLGNVRLDARVELGRKGMKLSAVRQLRKNDVIELDKLAGECFALRLNGVEIAAGLVSVAGNGVILRLTRLKELNQGGRP